MRIIYLIDDFPPDKTTSSGILTLNLAKMMAKSGHKVFIITTVQYIELAGETQYQGIKVHKIYTKYNNRWRWYLSLYNPQVVGKVKEIIKNVNPDICHFQHIHTYISYYCFKIAKKNSKAVFLTSHDVMLFSYAKLLPKNGNCFYKLSVFEMIKQVKKRYNPFRNMIIRHYLKYIDKIFSVSNAVEKILKINGIKNVVTIYNGINVSDFILDQKSLDNFNNKYKLSGRKVILFGGRLSGAKGGEAILKALLIIIKRVPNVILLIAGNKDEYAETMIKIAKEYNVHNHIIFTGWLNRNDITVAYYAADVVVVPSLYLDPFPTINLEAMATKTPLVSTCFGGSSEIVLDNKTGYIVNPYKDDLLAEKIIDLLENEKKAIEFGLAGYIRLKENFSLDVQFRNNINWYYKFTNGD